MGRIIINYYIMVHIHVPYLFIILFFLLSSSFWFYHSLTIPFFPTHQEYFLLYHHFSWFFFVFKMHLLQLVGFNYLSSSWVFFLLIGEYNPFILIEMFMLFSLLTSRWSSRLSPSPTSYFTPLLHSVLQECAPGLIRFRNILLVTELLGRKSYIYKGQSICGNVPFLDISPRRIAKGQICSCVRGPSPTPSSLLALKQ